MLGGCPSYLELCRIKRRKKKRKKKTTFSVPVRIHEIFSTVILSLPLIQEGKLSVSGKRMCTILVNHVED